MQLLSFFCVYMAMESVDNETILIKKILAGNLHEFRILVRKYKKLVYHIVVRFVSNKADQEELGQEIFIKIYENLPSFQFKSKLSTWIDKIAYHTCLNYLRKKKTIFYENGKLNKKHEYDTKKSGFMAIDEIPSHTVLPDDIIQQDQISSFLQKEINRLPFHYRQVITLYHLDDMSQQEIAEIMDLPIGTVKSYIFRARRLLKDRLLAKYSKEELCL